MLKTGESIGADHAEAVRAINKTLPLDTFKTETLGLATKVAAKLDDAFRIGKEVFTHKAS